MNNLLKGKINAAITFKVLVLNLLVICSDTAFAHEYEAYARSATGTGRAYAGEVTKTEDATSVFANPAAISYVKEKNVSAVLHLMSFGADYQVIEAVNRESSVGGSNDGDAGGIFGGPNVYWVSDDFGDLKFGVGLNTPYAYGTDYDANWRGRYHGTLSELTVFSLTSSASYRISENLSIGVSIPISYALVDFERKLNQPGRCRDLGISCASNSPLSLTGVDDGDEAVSADGVGIGIALGLHYMLPNSDTRFGLVYRAEETLSLSGDVKYNNIDPNITNTGLWINTRVDTDLVLPASLTLGVAQPVAKKVTVMADVTWKDWSEFDGWTFEYRDGQQANHRIATNWGDGVRTAIAFDYVYSDKLTLRAGYAYDNSPVNNPRQQSPLIPGADINWFTLGASWIRDNGSRIDIGYAFLNYDDAPIDATSTFVLPNENVSLKSAHNLDLHLLSMQYSF